MTIKPLASMSTSLELQDIKYEYFANSNVEIGCQGDIEDSEIVTLLQKLNQEIHQPDYFANHKPLGPYALIEQAEIVRLGLKISARLKFKDVTFPPEKILFPESEGIVDKLESMWDKYILGETKIDQQKQKTEAAYVDWHASKIIVTE